jgi:hypothetical protein
MAATPEKFEKVVITKAHFHNLERSHRMLVHLITPILRFREDIILKLEKCYRKRPSALVDFSRSEIEAAKSVIHASIPTINDFPDRFEPYVLPSDRPEIRRLEEREQEMMKELEELRAFRAAALSILETHGKNLLLMIARGMDAYQTKAQVAECVRKIEFLNKHRAEPN